MSIALRSKRKKMTQDAAKKHYVWSAERRRFVRFPCGWKIKFCDVREANPHFNHGKCRDLSQGGMKLTAFQPLKRKSVVLLEIDSDLFSVHIQIDPILKISENRILAEVVWRHLNLETGLFEAGLEFLKESQRKYYQADLEAAAQI